MPVARYHIPGYLATDRRCGPPTCCAWRYVETRTHPAPATAGSEVFMLGT